VKVSQIWLQTDGKVKGLLVLLCISFIEQTLSFSDNLIDSSLMSLGVSLDAGLIDIVIDGIVASVSISCLCLHVQCRV
jgi:hypothetical protein